MELKGKYSFDFGYLESNVREAYVDGIERLRNSEGLKSHIRIVNDIFSSLGQSHPAPGKATEWAGDIIEAYRSTVEMLNEIKKTIPEEEYSPENLPENRGAQERISALENRFNSYSSFIPRCSDTKKALLDSTS